MRILYLSTSYIPNRGADSVHVMRMCAALAAHHEVELIAKTSATRHEPDVQDPFAFYGVPRLFKLTHLARPSVRGGGLVFSLQLAQFLGRRAGRDRLVYSRDVTGAWIAATLGYRVCFEAHGIPRNRTHAFALARLMSSPGLVRLVVITRALGDVFREKGLIPRHADVVVAPDATNPMSIPPPRDAISGRLRIGYVGHVYPGRGVEVLLGLARRMPEHDFEIVGGEARGIAQWAAQNTSPNLCFRGFTPPAQLPDVYGRYDVLLMPYQKQVRTRSGGESGRFMSPMKMFEYMATGRPIISSDLPVLREVLRDGDTALLVPADDLGAWARAIERLAGDWRRAKEIGANARAKVLNSYTWAARARAVLDGIASEPPSELRTAGRD
jgi:glycosyltransferase involved in cell wall biosynthesis